MKKITIYYLLILAVMFNLSSCGDKDTAEPSRLELLTSKTWLTNKVSASSFDFSEFLKGTTITFNKDKTFIANSSILPDSGNWEFASDETIIVIEPGTSDEQRWTLTELQENSLKATIINPDDNIQFQVELVPAP